MSRRAVAATADTNYDRSLSKKDACNYLSISRWTLQRRIRPHHYVGRRPYWLLSELNAFRDSNKTSLL